MSLFLFDVIERVMDLQNSSNLRKKRNSEQLIMILAGDFKFMYTSFHLGFGGSVGFYVAGELSKQAYFFSSEYQLWLWGYWALLVGLVFPMRILVQRLSIIILTKLYVDRKRKSRR
jgi:hypothetical protein